MTRFLLSLLLLTGIYLLVLGSFHPWDVLLGLLIALTLLVSFRHFLYEGPPPRAPHFLRRIVAFFPFVGMVVIEILKGCWRTIAVTLGLHPLGEYGFVTLPIGERTAQGVAVLGLIATLTPSTYLIEVDWEQKHLLFHLLDASDPDGWREAQRRFYQKYQSKVFP